MSDARLCPNCGYVLRLGHVSGSVTAGRYFVMELVYWAVLAVLLGFLWKSDRTGERVAGLGAIALLVGLFWRSRQRANRKALMERGAYYYCDQCHYHEEVSCAPEQPLP
jgi:hypothetical protein